MTDKLVPAWLGTSSVLDVPSSGNATSTQVVLGSDTRLSDARTPTAHAASHASAGSDPVTPASIGAATAADITAAVRPMLPKVGSMFTSVHAFGEANRAMDRGRIVLTPIWIGAAVNIDAVVASLVSTAAAGCVARAGVMGSDATGAPDPTVWCVDAGARATDVAPGQLTWTFTARSVSGLVWAWIGSQGPSTSTFTRRTYEALFLQPINVAGAGYRASLSTDAATAYANTAPMYDTTLDCEPVLGLRRSA